MRVENRGARRGVLIGVCGDVILDKLLCSSLLLGLTGEQTELLGESSAWLSMALLKLVQSEVSERGEEIISAIFCEELSTGSDT